MFLYDLEVSLVQEFLLGARKQRLVLF